MKRIKDCLRNLIEKWSVLPCEKSGMDNIRSHLDSLNAFWVDKIPERQMCKEQIRKIKRAIRIRRIRAFFGLFSVNSKKVKDFEETLSDGLFSVFLVIRILLSRFSIHF